MNKISHACNHSYFLFQYVNSHTHTQTKMPFPQGSLVAAVVPNSDSMLHVHLSGLRLSEPVSLQTCIPIQHIPHTTKKNRAFPEITPLSLLHRHLCVYTPRLTLLSLVRLPTHNVAKQKQEVRYRPATAAKEMAQLFQLSLWMHWLIWVRMSEN